MARKMTTELRYYPVDVARVHDTKLRALIRTQDFVAYYVYDVLLSMIYGDKGYYLEWTEDALMEIADCARCDEGKVTGILQEMLRRRLFDLELFSTKSILTSAGIQRRYLQAMKLRMRRRCSPTELMLAEYLLLDEEETGELMASADNFAIHESGMQQDESFPTTESDKGKETKPKERERKAEQRRGEETTAVPDGTPGAPAAPPALQVGSVTLSQMEYEALCGKFGREQTEAKAAKLDAWMQERGKRVANCFTTLRAWLSEDAAKERERQKAAERPVVGKRTGAHNFSQRAYTDEELDEEFAIDLDRLRMGP